MPGSTSSGHTHGVPNCELSLSGLVCFDGRVNVLGGSLSWASHEWPVTLVAAACGAMSKGRCIRRTAMRSYHGQTLGGWIDAVWDWRDNWQVAARFEALERHAGPVRARSCAGGRRGGSLAQLAGTTLHRGAGLQPDPAWRLSAEIGNERTGGTNNPFVMLRVVWTAPWLLSGQW